MQFGASTASSLSYATMQFITWHTTTAEYMFYLHDQAAVVALFCGGARCMQRELHINWREVGAVDAGLQQRLRA